MLLQAALALLLPAALAAPPPASEDYPDFSNATLDAILDRMHDISEDYPDFSNATLDRDLELDDRAINTCDCARVSDTSRIVGGSEVSPRYKLPYQVLVYTCPRGRCSQKSHCGGTIVNKRYVVTAAHCIFREPGSYWVMMGEHNKCDGLENEGGKVISVSAVYMHPRYDSDDPYNHDNDIAVLRLSKDITFSANVKPACLPTSTTKDYSGQLSTISGWGNTIQYDHKQPDEPVRCVLKESVVKVLRTSSPKCSNFLRTSSPSSYSSTTMLCAWAKGTDTCQNDSGGPLTVAEGGKYVLLGVTSYGAGCATSTPGVYARVQGYLPWLQYIIADGECKQDYYNYYNYY